MTHDRIGRGAAWLRMSRAGVAAVAAVVLAGCGSTLAAGPPDRPTPSATPPSTTMQTPSSTTPVTGPDGSTTVPVGAEVPATMIHDPDFVTATDGIGYDFSGGIATTSDSGATWTAVAVAAAVPDGVNLAVGLHFSSRQVGYLAGDYTENANGLYTGGQLEQTSDGGHTWTAVPAVTGVTAITSTPTAVYAVAPTGHEEGQGPTQLWTSTDQGATWHSLPVPVPAGRAPLDVASLNPSTLYVLASSNTRPGAELLVTTNSGQTWTTQQLPCAGGDPSEAPLSADSSTDLWLVCAGGGGAGNQGKTVYRSHDSGAHWTEMADVAIGQQPDLGTIPSGGYVNQLTAVSATTAYLGLNRGTLLASTDGGRDWHNVIPEGGDDQTYFNMLTPTTGVAMVDGQAWHTTTGTTWNQPRP